MPQRQQDRVGPDFEYDAYSLFHQRSLAMGWLDDRSAGGGAEDRMRRAPGLWAMNDAGCNDRSIASGADLISSLLQVGPVVKWSAFVQVRSVPAAVPWRVAADRV